MNKKIRYLVTGILLIGIVLILISIFIGYNINPNEAYSIDKGNLIDDGSFENFNTTAWDCCPNNAGNASIFASKSTDAINGGYSLNLTSLNHCSCSSFFVKGFRNNEKYILSFYYKGDNPRFCNWVDGDKKCLPNKILNSTKGWVKYEEELLYTENSLSSKIVFYADSDGTRTVTNLYDDLQVRRLIPIENPSSYEYNPDEEYIFKTKADNNVHDAELISEIDAKTGEAYFLSLGKPNVTIKFPWTELVIVIIMMLIIIRLLFKKQVVKAEKFIEKEVEDEAGKIQKDVDKMLKRLIELREK